jgi:ABC-type tungstate transport system permease subunit
LAKNAVDVAITYHGFLEQVALDMAVIDRVAYGWRDRWMLVGPSSNPAGLKDDLKQSIYRLFMDLYIKMEGSKDTKAPIQFLSRWDKSASNVKEQEIWSYLGHVPWVAKVSMFICSIVYQH